MVSYIKFHMKSNIMVHMIHCIRVHMIPYSGVLMVPLPLLLLILCNIFAILGRGMQGSHIRCKNLWTVGRGAD